MAPMQTITRKNEIKIHIDDCLIAYEAMGLRAALNMLHQNILLRKTKFPLLEYCAERLYEHLPAEVHLECCDHIHDLQTEGGNVIIGKWLQLRLSEHFSESLDKATSYLRTANIWYISDIIGERVIGYGLLHFTDQTFPRVNALEHEKSEWIIRGFGAGIHYAIKRGLSQQYVHRLFAILLDFARHKKKNIRQGIGWAAKTTAKFHPSIITKFKSEIDDDQKTAPWFRKKIKIGLMRHHHAQKDFS